MGLRGTELKFWVTLLAYMTNDLIHSDYIAKRTLPPKFWMLKLGSSLAGRNANTLCGQKCSDCIAKGT